MNTNKLYRISESDLPKFIEELRARFDYCDIVGRLTYKTDCGGVTIGEYAGGVLAHGKRAGYTSLKFKSEIYSMHQLVWLHQHGVVAGQVDHIDGDKSNNLLENLRECTTQENNWNKVEQSTNTSGHRGVRVNNGKKRDTFSASIIVSGKSIRLGTFKTFDEAVDARVSAEQKIFGQFAPQHLTTSKVYTPTP
jgi:hypothetical protein